MCFSFVYVHKNSKCCSNHCGFPLGEGREKVSQFESPQQILSYMEKKYGENTRWIGPLK